MESIIFNKTFYKKRTFPAVRRTFLAVMKHTRRCVPFERFMILQVSAGILYHQSDSGRKVSPAATRLLSKKMMYSRHK